MELVDILILVSTVVLILLLWIIVGYRHLKHLKKNIGDQWEEVDENIRKRHEFIPLMVEILRLYTGKQEPLIEKLIKQRAKAIRHYSPGARKIEYEHDLTRSINKLVDLGRIYEDFAKDFDFLELRKDVDGVEDMMELKVVKYNEMVRYFNRHRKSILMRPLAAIFRFKRVNIFEVEK